MNKMGFGVLGFEVWGLALTRKGCKFDSCVTVDAPPIHIEYLSFSRFQDSHIIRLLSIQYKDQ